LPFQFKIRELMMIKKLLPLLFLFAGFQVNASVIAVDDWWLQTDTNGGLRESTTNSDYFFAVSQSNIWDKSATYESIAGYHIATTAEGIGVFNRGVNNHIYTYHGHGGWSGYVYAGLTRQYFRFSDSDTTNASKYVGNCDGCSVQYNDTVERFAGFVMVKDYDVPEPSIIALFGLGLVGIGFARRRQS
jgi:hypothetical protein